MKDHSQQSASNSSIMKGKEYNIIVYSQEVRKRKQSVSSHLLN